MHTADHAGSARIITSNASKQLRHAHPTPVDRDFFRQVITAKLEAQEQEQARRCHRRAHEQPQKDRPTCLTNNSGTTARDGARE